MAVQVYKGAGAWAGGYDISGQVCGLGVEVGAQMQDATTLDLSTRKSSPTLRTGKFAIDGLWYAGGTDGAPDKQLLTNVGTADVPFTVAPTRSVGSRAYFMLANQASYKFGGKVGDLMKFMADAEVSGTSGVVKGVLIYDSSGIAASSAGTKVEVGAVAAGKSMYAALHVMAAGTGTLDVVLQSDADSSAGSETNRITFTQATGITSEIKSVAGAITDTFWRASFTIGGGAPSFTFALAIGVFPA